MTSATSSFVSSREPRRLAWGGSCPSVPINVAQATLGSKIRVRTVDGKKVALKVPPGTQSGTRFRIPGQGVEKAGRRGDQYVQVKITVPGELTDEEQTLMREFARAANLKY